MSGHLLLLNIAGAAALLLWATRMVRTGITRAYGGELRRCIGRSTGNRVTAAAMGVASAALLQSSAATALLIVSFAGRGLVTVAAGLALMLGADLGSTLVVQILSFDIAWISPALILVGVALFLTSALPFRRHIGRVFIGLGLLLLSLQLIIAASEPLRESTILPLVVQTLAGDPILGFILAGLLAWLAHSSVAIVLLVMTFAQIGLVPPVLGLALVLGANVGSGLIPFALTFSEPPKARRIPLGNLLFRALGAVLVLPFVGLLAPLLASLEADPARLVANFHSLFNLGLLVLCLPLIGLMARATGRLLPERDEGEGPVRPRYLEAKAVATPTVAIAGATREILRLADIVESMLRGVIEVLRSGDPRLRAEVSKLDDDVDSLHEAIKLYLADVSRRPLEEEERQRCHQLMTFITNLEHVGDIIDKSLLEIAQKKAKKKLSFSSDGWKELEAMHARVVEQMDLGMSLFVSGDLEIARRILSEKEKLRDAELEGRASHLDRLRKGRIETIETSSMHLDVLRDFKRIGSHLSALAYMVLDAEGELRPTRLKPEEAPEGTAAGRDGKDESEEEYKTAGKVPAGGLP